MSRLRAWLREYEFEIIGAALVVAMLLSALVLVACGRGPVCPRLANGGTAQPPSQCPAAPRACAHRQPVPTAPLLTGFADVDATRLGEWQHRLETWAALACGGEP